VALERAAALATAEAPAASAQAGTVPLRWRHPSHGHELYRSTTRNAGCDVCEGPCANASYACADGCDYDVCGQCMLSSAELVQGCLDVSDVDKDELTMPGDTVTFAADTALLSLSLAGCEMQCTAKEILDDPSLGVPAYVFVTRALTPDECASFVNTEDLCRVIARFNVGVDDPLPPSELSLLLEALYRAVYCSLAQWAPGSLLCALVTHPMSAQTDLHS